VEKTIGDPSFHIDEAREVEKSVLAKQHLNHTERFKTIHSSV